MWRTRRQQGRPPQLWRPWPSPVALGTLLHAPAPSARAGPSRMQRQLRPTMHHPGGPSTEAAAPTSTPRSHLRHEGHVAIDPGAALKAAIAADVAQPDPATRTGGHHVHPGVAGAAGECVCVRACVCECVSQAATARRQQQQATPPPGPGATGCREVSLGAPCSGKACSRAPEPLT